MRFPKVSVVISTYERPEMLERALQSCLDQTYEDFEVIVVDDGSDTAGEVCERMRHDFDSRAVPLIAMNLEENTGYQCVPKNVGISYARGSYVAYLDDDNEFDPKHLEILVKKIEGVGTDAVYSRWRNKGDLPAGIPDVFSYHQMNRASALGLTQTPMANFIDTSAILHAKGHFARKLGENIWNPEVRRFGDWEMVARSLGKNITWHGVDRVTFTYWWHGENLQITRPPDEHAVRRAAP